MNSPKSRYETVLVEGDWPVFLRLAELVESHLCQTDDHVLCRQPALIDGLGPVARSEYLLPSQSSRAVFVFDHAVSPSLT